MLNVESIQNGVVIDHIPAGKGMDIYRLLELESKTQSVALLQSVKSQKYGCKDLIKIEGASPKQTAFAAITCSRGPPWVPGKIALLKLNLSAAA